VGASRPPAKFTISFVAGLLLLPVAAVLAVAMTPQGSPSAAATPTAQPATTTESRQVVFGAVGEATADDLARACGPAGVHLVELEATGTITPLQQAALDALRPICEGQGLPLAGKPEVEPIVRTVTVEAVASAAGTTPPPTTTTATQAPAPTNPPTTAPASTTSVSTTTTTAATSAEQAYLEVHERAVEEIAYAVSVGGSEGKIDEARQKLAEAERDAANGKWNEATTHAWEAIGQARESIGGGDGG